MTDPIVRTVQERLAEFGRQQGDKNSALEYEVTTDGGVKLTVRRGAGIEPVVVVEMTGTSEVFFLILDEVYQRHSTAYEPTSKLEAVDDLLEDAESYLAGRYFEDVYERDGKEIYKVLHLSTNRGPSVIEASLVPLGSLRRYVGCVKRRTYPEPFREHP
ncbi:MAG: hypothetical protein ACJ72N_25170 [Labedaea sp.]